MTTSTTHRTATTPNLMATLLVLITGLAGLGGCATGDTDSRTETFQAGDTEVTYQLNDELADQLAAYADTSMTVYGAVPGDAALSAEELASALDLKVGDAQDAGNGAVVITEGERTLVVYADGTAAYIDGAFVPGDEAINAMPDELVWDTSEAFLDEIRALQQGPMQLAAEAVEHEYATLDSGEGDTVDAMVMHHAVYEQRIEDLPGFGPGSRVTVQMPGDDFVVGLEVAVRNLEPLTDGEPQSPGDAMKTWMGRAADGDAWNLHGYEGVTIVQVDIAGSPELGYHFPAAGSPSYLAEPVWHLEGTAVIEDKEGNVKAVDFEWNEPAIAGRPAPRS